MVRSVRPPAPLMLRGSSSWRRPAAPSIPTVDASVLQLRSCRRYGAWKGPGAGSLGGDQRSALAWPGPERSAIAGKVHCVNVPGSRQYAGRRPTTSCTPGKPCGCELTITLGPEPDHHPKDRQSLAYGTTAWAANYGRRVAVESYNAELKTHRGKLERGLTRVFGLIKNALLLAIYLGAVNARIIADTYPHHPHDGTPAPTPIQRRKPRNQARHRALTRFRSPPTNPERPTPQQ